MNISIICVGKIKEKFYREAIGEYSKRLSRYCKLDIVEVADEKTPDNASDKEELQIKEKEGEGILKNIKDNIYVIAMDIKGEMLTSELLAGKIKDLGVSGDSNIAFVIGGSLGLSKKVLDRADFKLSFSRMTFPHQLFRVMILEQVYRGFRINAGEPYHK
ncbi:MAG: 23S rRNA (pseudouridine(1915)-N(3))-methyltransferase RlmH [Clostridiaceae bacterium]|nr:23S rRNA (pseudouridine(1915)-N(3))-methyltransferase RlmH [Clostridiaceae bacterium]